jgi:DnaK suppressor protein
MTGAEPELLEEFRNRLRAARAELLRTASVTHVELASLERWPSEPFDEVSMADATGTLSRLEGRERHQLDEILAALNRLEAGTYGTCEACSRAISLARLRAVPSTRHCVDCQRRAERGAPGPP